MEQQSNDMGLPLELASQALAATGSKSNLKATEWIMRQRDAAKMSGKPMGQTSSCQPKMEHFLKSANPAQAISRGVALQDSNFDGAAIECARNSSDSLERLEMESDEQGGVTPGSGARAGIVGGFDSKTGAALGWRSVNSVLVDKGRGEYDDIRSSGGGLVVAAGRLTDAKYGGQGPSGRREEEASDSSTKFKRAMALGAVNQIGSSSAAKRHKQDPAEVSPRRTLAPIFSSPPLSRPNKQKATSGTPKHCLTPLAERMRPLTIDEVVGQEHLLGDRQLLRTLLDNHKLPSIILYGPPGTGKTTLARAIAHSTPNVTFVGLSAVNSGTKEVKEVLERARHGQRTLLFLDEVHRFNKAQQDLFLPSVEAGHIAFIGATTENPSFEITSALMSRCHLLTLYKLKPEQLRKVLERAIVDRERGVLASLPDIVCAAGQFVVKVEDEALNFLAGAADGDARVALNALDAATASAYSELKRNLQDVGVPVRLERVGSSGSLGVLKIDSRFINGGFNSKRFEPLRESTKEISPSIEDYSKPFKRFVGGKDVTPPYNPSRFEREAVSLSNCEGGKDATSFRGAETTETAERRGGSNPDAIVPEGESLDRDTSRGAVITVSLAQAQEAFQRSHVNYDKTGEEHYNIISALHKSMRGGNADAAIYWLARMLEGGEGPLYVARRLIRFASEDVGVADDNALKVAVACYQACHFLGMPECNVNLAQCVVYLALAPKSVVVYQAIEAAQKLIRESHNNEPVPLHLRNAPTRLMKEMGYGKGYVYPPGQSTWVEQDYLPPSLHGHKFLRWS